MEILLLTFALTASFIKCKRGCPGDNYCCVKLEGTIEGTCEATGYVPGGNKVILEPIEAPQAVLQGNHIFIEIGNVKLFREGELISML